MALVLLFTKYQTETQRKEKLQKICVSKRQSENVIKNYYSMLRVYLRKQSQPTVFSCKQKCVRYLIVANKWYCDHVTSEAHDWTELNDDTIDRIH